MSKLTSYKQPSIVSGLTIQQVMELDINNYKKADLQKIVGRLVSAANKRLRTFERNDETSPAYREAMKGGKFSTKGKDLNALRHEWARAKAFLESPTSTVKGWYKVRKETIETLKKDDGIDLRESAVKAFEKDKTPEEIEEAIEEMGGQKAYDAYIEKETNDIFDVFWRSYENIKDAKDEVKERAMKYTVLDEITNYLVDRENTPDDIASDLMKRVDELYVKLKEEEERRANGFSGVSGLL